MADKDEDQGQQGPTLTYSQARNRADIAQAGGFYGVPVPIRIETRVCAARKRNRHGDAQPICDPVGECCVQ